MIRPFFNSSNLSEWGGGIVAYVVWHGQDVDPVACWHWSVQEDYTYALAIHHAADSTRKGEWRIFVYAG